MVNRLPYWTESIHRVTDGLELQITVTATDQEAIAHKLLEIAGSLFARAQIRRVEEELDCQARNFEQEKKANDAQMHRLEKALEHKDQGIAELQKELAELKEAQSSSKLEITVALPTDEGAWDKAAPFIASALDKRLRAGVAMHLRDYPNRT